MAAPRTLASFQDLLDLLSAEGVASAPGADPMTVEIPARSGALDSVCYIRWEQEIPCVQVICPFALAVPAERHAELEGAIVRVNNASPFPGVGLDHERGTLYFRYTVVVYPDGVPAATFQKVVVSVVNHARELIVPFRGVIEGQPGAQILAAVLAHAQAGRASPPVAKE
jgi:hypothetical protein